MLTSHEHGILSKQSLIAVITCLLPRKLGKETTLYDVGYEAAKADIANVIGRHLNIDFSDNPARQLIKALDGAV